VADLSASHFPTGSSASPLADGAETTECVVHDVADIRIVKSDDGARFEMINNPIVADPQSVAALEFAAEREKIKSVAPAGGEGLE
jgi:hypothetical protein